MKKDLIKGVCISRIYSSVYFTNSALLHDLLILKNGKFSVYDYGLKVKLKLDKRY